MTLKFYIPTNSDLPFDSVRLAYSSVNERRFVTTPPFGKPVLILFIHPKSVKNYHTSSKGILLGQHTHPLILDMNDNFKVLAFHLKPYALKQLLNMDASQLTNKHMGIKGLEVIEKLYNSVVQAIDNEKELIQEINRFFDSITLHPVSYEVLNFLNYLDQNPPSTIGEMSKAIGLTERNLERKFKTEVGISPKKYLQIRRVFEVFETLGEKNDWQQLVVDHNYTDQAHLINEFKKYADIAPGLYVRKGLTVNNQLPPISHFEI